MKRLLAIMLLSMLAGCASVSKVESGDRAVGQRLTVTLEGAWNQVNAPGLGPAQIWTMEGLPVDQLLLYSGIKDGQPIANQSAGSNSKAKDPNFHAAMQPDQIVALFEGMFTRDGSIFQLKKLEPASFGGGKGFRFEYALTRKKDEVQLLGVGYGVVDKDELFALVYLAPRLVFFARHQNRVEQIAHSARVKA